MAVSEGSPPVPDALAVLAATSYGIDLDVVVAAERFTGRPGEVLRVPVQAPPGVPARLLLVGTGGSSSPEVRRAGAALARAIRGRGTVLTSLAGGLPPSATRALVEGLLLGGYRPPARGTKNRDDTAAAREVVLLGSVDETEVERGRSHAVATATARDLAMTPSNVKNPRWLAELAVAEGERAGLVVRVLTGHELVEEGFGGLVAVGGGSAVPPALVRLDYVPSDAARGRETRPVVLVGKGITFDTGGLSIKPRESMVPMKTDMAGAGAVLAALLACPGLGVRRPVTGLLALAENAVGGASYRPGDVVRHVGGRTVEVSNTDAEGRMVLADALAYADSALDPDVVVDLATLTGAVTLGLGRRHAALFTGDDALAAELEAAGGEAGEAVWRLPLVEDYRSALDSSVADLRHLADGPVGAGAVVAALFLREFAGRRRWAHLDIAGTARADKDEYEISRGATGYGARLLLRWLEGLR
ncbi:MAG: leucyl aminopeptidase [Actinomycetota bacterium]|nr:leucyl aminopeptidase [Actinomycetota bacterium]